MRIVFVADILSSTGLAGQKMFRRSDNLKLATMKYVKVGKRQQSTALLPFRRAKRNGEFKAGAIPRHLRYQLPTWYW